MPTPLQFKKKLGFHRGNRRIFFETDKIQPFGFVPGARYTVEGDGDMARFIWKLTLATNEKGERAVCKKAKGDRVLSVIDINSAIYMEGFKNDTEVMVTVTPGVILIERIKEQA